MRNSRLRVVENAAASPQHLPARGRKLNIKSFKLYRLSSKQKTVRIILFPYLRTAANKSLVVFKASNVFFNNFTVFCLKKIGFLCKLRKILHLKLQYDIMTSGEYRHLSVPPEYLFYIIFYHRCAADCCASSVTYVTHRKDRVQT